MTIERECSRLNRSQVGDKRAARLTALDMPFERPLLGGVERAVDELGNRVAVVAASHKKLSALNSRLSILRSPASDRLEFAIAPCAPATSTSLPRCRESFRLPDGRSLRHRATETPRGTRAATARWPARDRFGSQRP